MTAYGRLRWPGVLCHLVLLGILLVVVSTNANGQNANVFVAHIATEKTRADALRVYHKLRHTFLAKENSQLLAQPFIHGLQARDNPLYKVRLGPLTSRSGASALCQMILSAGHEFCEVRNAFDLAEAAPGYYGDLLLRPLSDGRNMEVVSPFGFVDNQARRWEVPAGAVTDGASIPKAFWSLIGSPFAGKFRLAAVLHDHYCKTKDRNWTDTHDAFFEAMVASGEDRRRALLMWSAVYRFGPRWAEDESHCWNVCAGENVHLEAVDILPEYVESVFRKIREKVSQTASREEVRRFIDENTYYKPEGGVYGAVIRGMINDPGAQHRRAFVTIKNPPVNWHQFGVASYAIFLPKDYRVAGLEPNEALRMHSGPEESAAVVATIPSSGTNIILLEPCRNEWCRIRYNSREGWVRSKYLDLREW